MPSASLGPISLFFTDVGDGPPLLLLHGLGSCGDDWLFQTPEFSTRFRVIAPNLRGHQPSSLIAGPITVADLAADIAALMDVLDVAAAHVVGLSLGGLVAQQLAIDFPRKVKRLVLTNAFAHLWPTSLREVVILSRRAIVSALLPLTATARIVAADLFSRPEQLPYRQAVLDRIAANDARSYRYLVGAIRRFDTRRQLDRITAPTLIVTGDRDNVVPRGCQQQLANGIPDSRWIVVKDSGHVTPIDQPEEFNRIVLPFLIPDP